MRFIKIAIACTALFAASSFTLAARADDPAAPTPPATTVAPAEATAPAPGPAPPVEAKEQPVKPPEEEFKSVAITANPLSLLIVRGSVNIEYLPVKHHAIVVNPYFQRNVFDEQLLNIKYGESTFTTFGAEAGYRFYSGSNGASGLFVGPSFFMQRTHASVEVPVNNTINANGPTPTTKSEGDMTVYGGIIDIGGQTVLKGGFTAGAGAGLMYMWTSSGPTSSSTSRYSGLSPRLLLTVGYSF